MDIDGRYYMRLAANGVLALRFRGLKSWGNNPSYLSFGGNSEMRGYEYLEFVGQKAWFGNAELRFPLVEAMLTPFGVIGGLRGVLFFDIGNAGYNVAPADFITNKTVVVAPIIGYQQIDIFGNIAPVYGPPIQVSGIRLVDGRASYGIGLESFLLGSSTSTGRGRRSSTGRGRTCCLRPTAAAAGSARKFSFWIGYDF
jgi:outer membrane protein assembly factor BamA